MKAELGRPSLAAAPYRVMVVDDSAVIRGLLVFLDLRVQI